MITRGAFVLLAMLCAAYDRGRRRGRVETVRAFVHVARKGEHS